MIGRKCRTARLARAAACALLLLAGAAAAMDEVPFVTTPDNVTVAMLELARVGPRDYVIDLGSGDGRIVIAAATRFGARGLGIEYVPDLVRQSIENARAAGVADRAKFRVQDLHDTDLSPASVVTLYLLTEVNLELRPRLLELRPGTRIVSHDWDMGEWRADRTVSVDAPDKQIGREKRSTLLLWIVPARVEGDWCSARASLAFRQSFQDFDATLVRDRESFSLRGHIRGTQVATDSTGTDALSLEWHDGRLRVREARGRFAALRGTAFTRARSQGCS
jgi:SAM-dependent methyltransferase